MVTYRTSSAAISSRADYSTVDSSSILHAPYWSKVVLVNRLVLPTPELLVFDADATLIGGEEFYQEVYRRTINEMQRRHSTIPSHDTSTLYPDVTRGLVENYSYYLGESYVPEAALLHYHYRSSPDISPRVLEGAIDLLAFLKERGIPYAVVSNAHQHALELNIRRAFGSSFDELLGNSVPILGDARKPDPQVLKDAILSLGVVPSPRVYYVGDDATQDLEAAANLGIPFILVGKHGPQKILERQSGGAYFSGLESDSAEILQVSALDSLLDLLFILAHRT